METKNGIIILLVIFVAAIVAISFYYFLTIDAIEAPPTTQIPIGAKEITPPLATGNIDDLVDALMKELADEGLLLAGEDGDAALVTTDSQEIGDFGQSINENEL